MPLAFMLLAQVNAFFRVIKLNVDFFVYSHFLNNLVYAFIFKLAYAKQLTAVVGMICQKLIHVNGEENSIQA